MKSIRIRFIAMGLTVAPFVLAGWFFASWLSSSAFAAADRPSLVVIDPPEKFHQIAQQQGFKILSTEELDEISMTAVRVRVPKGHRAHSAALLLRNYCPELVVDGTSIDYRQDL